MNGGQNFRIYRKEKETNSVYSVILYEKIYIEFGLEQPFVIIFIHNVFIDEWWTEFQKLQKTYSVYSVYFVILYKKLITKNTLQLGPMLTPGRTRAQLQSRSRPLPAVRRLKCRFSGCRFLRECIFYLPKYQQ